MYVTTTNPATGQPLPTKVAIHTADQVKAAFIEARQAQREWAKRSFKERARCVAKIKQFLAANSTRGAEVISDTNGKTAVDALQTEVLPCLMACDWYAKNAESILGPKKIRLGHILFANKSNTLEYVPSGVVGIVSPWNYPFAIPFGEVIMGLMAGNAVVLKVATQSVLVGEFIQECIDAGGLPKGLFRHLVMSGGDASRLMFENKVDKIFFTGSVGVGKKLMADASASLTPLSLELGGNDPAVVLPDADLERTTSGIAWAGYQNAGQSCGGVERVYVHRSIFDRFVELLAAKTRALTHGPPSAEPDIGAVTTKGQLATIKEHVDEAVARGARIVAQSQAKGDVSKGLFYPATLMVDVTHEMKLMREETFGPIIPVMPFDSIDEAIELANDSDLALTSSVWTADNTVGRAVARRIESGVTTLNDHLYTHGCAETPWGGWKLSGLGRTHGEIGLKEMCNAKAVNWDILPNPLIPRNIWWYPSAGSMALMKGAIGFVAPTSVGSCLLSLLSVLKLATPKMFTAWVVPGVSPPSRMKWCIVALCKTLLAIITPFLIVHLYQRMK